MESGWSIVSLVKNGVYYVGIMEKNEQKVLMNQNHFYSPRKKLKISSK